MLPGGQALNIWVKSPALIEVSTVCGRIWIFAHLGIWIWILPTMGFGFLSTVGFGFGFGIWIFAHSGIWIWYLDLDFCPRWDLDLVFGFGFLPTMGFGFSPTV